MIEGYKYIYCPSCKSEDVTFSDPEPIAGEQVTWRADCKTCASIWIEIYKYSHAEYVKKETIKPEDK